ncbi:MAG: TetR/AcrR family transcriptional regulator [Actinomycetales bacterium]|nr:MAG: TetR/AcrR family transcriptional regulator [Actinomycetales bacterium]
MTSDLSNALIDGPPDRRRRRTRAAVLDAARRLFVERGYGGTSVEELARDADIALASLYGNFPGGKAEVYAVLGCRIARDHAQRMQDALSSATGVQAAEEALTEYVRFHADEPAAFRILGLADLGPEARSDVTREAGREIADRLAAVMADVARCVSEAGVGEQATVRRTLLLAWASVNGTLALRERGLVDADTSAEMLADAQDVWIERLRRQVGTA